MRAESLEKQGLVCVCLCVAYLNPSYVLNKYTLNKLCQCYHKFKYETHKCHFLLLQNLKHQLTLRQFGLKTTSLKSGVRSKREVC